MFRINSHAQFFFFVRRQLVSMLIFNIQKSKQHNTMKVEHPSISVLYYCLHCSESFSQISIFHMAYHISHTFVIGLTGVLNIIICVATFRVRFHYGHPDVFDRLFHLTRGGVSKASKVINLSEDIFAGILIALKLFKCNFRLTLYQFAKICAVQVSTLPYVMAKSLIMNIYKLVKDVMSASTRSPFLRQK